MNKIDFQQTGGFPLDANIFSFLQNAWGLLQVFGELAGNLSILQGCTKNGNTVSDGVVYVDGELLPFKRSSGTKVIIKEERTALQFEDGNSKEVEITRYATMGVGSVSWNFSDFKRIDNIQQLMHKLSTHTHEWSAITGKPATFPPATHSHDWEAITGKPATFPPAPHSHSYNDLADKPTIGGQIVIAGKVGYNPRRVIRKFVGDFSVSSYPQNSGWTDHHKITHNIGHTDYIVTGSALGGDGARTVKLNCFYMTANYCYVVTADDATGNAADFVFQITSFR